MPPSNDLVPGRALREIRSVDVVMVAVIGFGIALRTWQYLGNDSFFLDEVAVFRNIVERPWHVLVTQPLAYDQVAPPGFLVFERLLLSVVGTSEYAARLFPFVCSAAALVLFAKLAERMFSRIAAIASTMMFACAGPLIVYAAQVKQYSTDVLASCVLLLAAVNCTTEHRERNYWVLSLAGAAMVWFSHPATIVLAGIGIVLLYEAARSVRRRAARKARQLVTALTIGGLSAIGSTLLAFHLLTPHTREYLHKFWAEGFPPSGLAAWVSQPWPFVQMHALYGSGGAAAAFAPLAFPAPSGFIVLTAVGLFILSYSKRDTGLLIVLPVLVTLAAGAVRQYPFSDRAILFLLPSFILAIGAATEAAGLLIGRFWAPPAVAVSIGIAAVACFPVLAKLPVYHFDHARPVIQHTATMRRQNEKLYVYYGMLPAFWYYGVRTGLTDTSVIAGGCHRGDSREYFHELDALRGSNRVFILLGHSLRVYREREDILRYVDAIGVRRSSYSESSRLYATRFSPVEVYEYDLSDDQKLGAASAERFPVIGPNKLNPAFPCGHGPQSITLSAR